MTVIMFKKTGGFWIRLVLTCGIFLHYRLLIVAKLFSNDIQEVYRTLGLGGSYDKSIFNELSEAMDHAGVYINYHHLSILCDRMCATSKMVSIFRHGINNDDIGPIAKASFEETPEMFLRAARHAELDLDDWCFI